MEITKEIIQDNDDLLNIVVNYIYNRYYSICSHNAIDKRELKYAAITALYYFLRKRDKIPDRKLMNIAIRSGLINFIRTSNGRSKHIHLVHVDEATVNKQHILPNQNFREESDAWIDIEYIKEHYTDSDRQRNAIDLLSLGYKPGDIAKILGVSYNSVYKYMRKVIDRYRQDQNMLVSTN